MVEIGVDCFGEFGRPSLFDVVPLPSVEGVLLVANGVMYDVGGSLYWVVGGVLVGVSLG